MSSPWSSQITSLWSSGGPTVQRCLEMRRTWSCKVLPTLSRCARDGGTWLALF
ncbi:unnamed protein product [Durusdinium trenchii]|uniref:Uncharacterized protein n=2 Tax=Durusdinium trenchii TaxID=1381693 RepID=A0ABP0HFK3_9DINO